jgi:hypothetical protein
MSGPKRNPDRLNTIGVVVVGICGAVLVYVTIVALQAFYVNDTAEIQATADYGGQDTGAKSLRIEQLSRINEYGTNPRPAAAKPNEVQWPQTYRIPVDVAMKLVAQGAKSQPDALIPALGPSDKATVLPIFGRPKLMPAAPAAPATGSGSAAISGDLSAAPVAPTATGPTGSGPTGSGPTGSAPTGGAGAIDQPATPADVAPTHGAPAGTPARGNGK